jgi:hypothetical protein
MFFRRFLRRGIRFRRPIIMSVDIEPTEPTTEPSSRVAFDQLTRFHDGNGRIKLTPLDLRGMPTSAAQLEFHGERVIEGFKEIASLAVVISTVGAGFMFSSILNEIVEPKSLFTVDRIRLFLVLSWGSFMLSLGLAGFLTLLLIFNSVEVANDWSKHNRWPIGTFVVCLFMLSAIMVAVILLLLIIMAYEFWVGVLGFCAGIIVFVGGVFLGFLQLYREMLGWYQRMRPSVTRQSPTS